MEGRKSTHKPPYYIYTYTLVFPLITFCNIYFFYTNVGCFFLFKYYFCKQRQPLLSKKRKRSRQFYKKTKEMKKLTLFTFTVLCAVFTLTSCDKTPTSDNLIGTWEWTSSTTYNEDGTTITEEATKENWQRITFTESKMITTSDELPNGLIPQTYAIVNDTIKTTAGSITYKIEKLTSRILKLKLNKWDIFNDGNYTIDTYKRK